MSKYSYVAPLKRDKRINVVANDDELAMLKALADTDGVSMSDYLRLYIRRRHAELFGEQASKPSKARKRK